MSIKPFHSLLILVLIFGISGCGFKLRGSAEPLPVQIRQLALVGIDKGSNLYQALAHALIGAGATLSQAEDSDKGALLTIHRVGQSRDEISASGGQTLYRATLEVVFSLSRDKQPKLIDSRKLRASREFSFDSNNPYGLEQQDILLRNELQQDLVRQMINQIRAVGSTH